MKNKFNMSLDDYSAFNEIASTLDEVYETVLSEQEQAKEREKAKAHKKKSRIPFVNKHTLAQHKADDPHNHSELAELSKAQPFNVLSLYQEREKNTTSKYLSHGDFTEADGHITRKISRRQISPQAKIDLHNMTQDEAHRALSNFIISASKNKYRIVLVITGKGKNGVGVIRQNIKEWINMHPIRQLVLGFDYAHNFDGGKGALNVLLRR